MAANISNYGFSDKIIANLSHIPYFQNRYMLALFILLGSFVIGKAIQLLFTFYMRRIATKTKTEIDDIIAKYLKSPLFYLILALGLKAALSVLPFNGVVSHLGSSLVGIAFLFVMLRAFDVAVQGWGMAFTKKTKSTLDDVLLPLFHKVGKFLFVLIGLMWVLHIWGVNITPYLAGVGLSGIVLGLALQDSLKNIFGGMSLIIDKTYQPGDKIKLESGEVGVIHEIGLRSTKLATYDNEIIFIPNGYLANSRVMNFTQPNSQVRSKVEFGVAYGSDVEKVKQIALAAIKDVPGLAKDPVPFVQFYEMGEFALKFRIFFWVEKWNEEVAKRVLCNELIYLALQKAKINIPFPTQTLYMEQASRKAKKR